MVPPLQNCRQNDASPLKMASNKEKKQYTASPPASADHLCHLDQDILLV